MRNFTIHAFNDVRNMYYEIKASGEITFVGKIFAIAFVLKFETEKDGKFMNNFDSAD